MSKNRLTLIIASLILSSSFQAYAFAADTSTSSDTEQTLSKLEDKFFEHEYVNDSDSDRLNRLDQFVFGCSQTGSTSDRVKHLLSTIPDDTMDKITGATNQLSNDKASNQTQTSNNTDTSSNNDSQSLSQNTDQASDDAAQGQAFSYSSYPSVTALEQELFSHTYPNDALPIRLARLETKAFGAPSTSSDMSQRVDALEDYAQRNDIYNARNTASNTNSPTFPIAPYRNRQRAIETNNQNTATAQPVSPSMDEINPFKPKNQEYISKTGSFVGSVEERVSMMEAQEFGHTYPDRPLDKRLKKLENKVLPNQDESQLGIFERTGKLWVALHPSDKSKVDNLLATKQVVDNRIVDKGSNATNSSSVSDAANPATTDDANPNTSKTARRNYWLNKLGNSISSPNQTGNQASNSSQSFSYPYPGTYMYNGNANAPAGYNSRSYGVSFGPGSGPAGLPVSFW